MLAEHTARETVVEPARSPAEGGAAGFYTRHLQADFLDVGYACAPPRIRAALAEEIEFLRRVLSGTERALELGCGDGRLLTALGDCARHWVGIDFVEDFLHRVRRRSSDSQLALAAGHIARLPFADAGFDAVLCAQSTLGLLGDLKPAVLAEVARVARPRARLVFVVYSELSVVPRIEWYAEMHRRGLMAPLDWARSTPALLLTEDGHVSECFRREPLVQLFAAAGLTTHIERLGEIYWAVQARKI